MAMHALPPAADSLPTLLAFNRQLIAQARGLVRAHMGAGAPRYAGPVGAHLRHVVEHHAALLQPAQPGWVDYDSRARSLALQTEPAEALRRLAQLEAALDDAALPAADTPVQVLGLAGLQGEAAFAVPSSLGRELAFVASHALHHFALLAPHCRQNGIPLPPGFGQAPATVAHERSLKETPCPLPA